MKAYVRNWIAGCMLAGLASTPCAAVPLAASTFDTGSEGWFVADWDGATHIVQTFAVTWHASGGNPGGYISSTDPSDNTFMFAAPAEFLGNQAVAYGGSLQFDLFDQYSNGTPEPTVILTGAGQWLYFQAPSPATTFTSYTVPLTPSGWRINDYVNGLQPTTAQMQTVLSSLDGLNILGDWHNGSDFSGLDNVSLNAEATSVPEPATWLLFATGIAGLLGYSRVGRQGNRMKRGKVR